ncbi:MAG: 50S ribosomal protein L4 [bacterium]
MATADIYNLQNETVGTIELSPQVFEVEPRPTLMRQVLVAYRANRRQGTADTRNRKDVRGGGRKPFRQKGTGWARQGTIRAPHMRGGATQFGPHPRSYRQRIPKRMRQEALRQTLSAKLRDGELLILDALDVSEPKTNMVYQALKRFGLRGRVKKDNPTGRRRSMEREGCVLLLDAKPSQTALLSIRNLQRVEILCAQEVSALHVDQARTLLITREGIQQLEQALGGAAS